MKERFVSNIVPPALTLAVVAALFIFVSGARAEDSLSTSTMSSAPTNGTLTPDAAPVEPFYPPLVGHKWKMVSGFGPRKILTDPANPAGPFKMEPHEGVDWAVPPGTAVHASRSGKVLFAGFSKMYASRTDKTDQSRFVIVRHEDGKSTRYVHLNTLKVRPGQTVLSGDIIGTTADSEEWKVPVFHFEIRDAGGKPLNPLKLLEEPPAAEPS